MAHLLVAGGAGYVGSHALRALRREGHTAVVLDDLRAGRPDFAQGAPLMRADIGDRARVADARRFRETFGWEPRRSDLPTILRTAWDWLAEWKGV